MQISVEEAAIRLGVSPVRVRELIYAGRIDAQKLGRQWLVDEESLAQKVWNRSPGRPLGFYGAFGLALLLEGQDFREVFSMPKSSESRIRSIATQVRSDPNPKSRLVSLMSARATSVELSISGPDLAELREEPRLFLSGVSDPLSGLLPGNELEAYIGEQDLGPVKKEWFLLEAGRGRKANIKLHVVPHLLVKVPAIFSAMDLAERPGPREQSAAESIIRRTLGH